MGVFAFLIYLCVHNGVESSPEIPLFLGAQYILDELAISASFDSDVSYEGRTDVFPCGSLFSFSGVMSSACRWISDREVYISMPAVGIAQPVVGDSFVVAGAIIQAKCPDNYPQQDECSFFPTMPSVTVPITGRDPKLESAVFFPDGSILRITFDHAVTFLGWARTFPCGFVFTYAGSTASSCQWVSDKVVDISFPSGTDYGAVLHDTFATYAGIFLPKCSLDYPDFESCEFLSPLPAYSVKISVANGVAPVLRLPAVLRVSSCLDPVIDASNSYGSGGRRWTSAFVNLTTSSSTANELNSFLQNTSSTFLNSKPLTVPSRLVEAGHVYTIVLTLCNFLSMCSSSAMKLFVESNPIPVIKIQQGSAVTLRRDTRLRLGLTYSLPFCDGSNLPTSQMGFNWTISTGGAILAVVSTSKDVTKYQLPAFSLQSGLQYKVISTVWNVLNPAQISSVTTVVDVTEASISAFIAGPSEQFIPFDKSLSFDASGSIDNNEPAAAQPALLYQWTCATTHPTALSSCPSLLITGASTKLLVVKYLSAAYTATMYEFTLIVTHPILSERTASTVVIATLAPPQAPEVSLTKSIATTKVNSFSPFKVTAVVNVLATENLKWAVNDTNVFLADVLSLASTTTLLPGSYNIVGTLQLSALDPGVAYQFSLTCGSTVASINVLVNRSPQIGQFSVTPLSGLEITDVFTFATSFWTDDDAPINFQFGFITSAGTKLIVQPAAEVSATKSVLPAGVEADGFVLQCYVTAFDSLGAHSSKSAPVVVNPFEGDQITSSLMASLNDAGTLDSLKKTISISSAVLNTGNCVSAPTCSTLNRESCGQVADTCGSCIPPFVGEPGPSNYPCISIYDYDLLTVDQEYCNADSDCPTWKVCSPESFVCEVASKSCNFNCSGHGKCLFFSNSGAPLNDCKMNDFTCTTSCDCDNQFYGYSCSLSGESVEENSAIRKTILDKLENSVALDELSIDSSISLISMLKAAALDHFSLTEDSSLAAVSISQTLIDVANDVGMSVENMLGVLESLQSVLLTYAPTPTRRRKLTPLTTNVLTGILSVIEKHGSAIANQWLAEGNRRNDVVLDQFTTSAEVFYADSSNTETATPSGGISGIQSHSILFISEPKDMSVLTTVMQSKFYPMAADIHTNPLKLIIKASNASSTVRFVLQHDRNIDFEAYPSNITFRTKCLEHSKKVEKFLCPNDFEVVHSCNGTSALLISRCPGIKTISVCRAVDLFGFVPDARCETESSTATSTTCVCQVESGSGTRRQLNDIGEDLEDSGYLEIAAMSEQTVEEFEKTIFEAQNFDSASDIQNVLTVIILFTTLWLSGLLCSYYFSMRSAMEQDNLKNMNQILKDTRLDALAKNARTVESIKRYMNNYIDQVFPCVYGALPWYKRLVKEVFRHHRYMNLFSTDSTPKDRFITTVHLLTVQTMLMFMLAVFYDIQFPVDDGSCDNLIVSNCKDEKSVFNARTSVCSWNSEEQLCEWNDPKIGWEIVIIISIVVAVFTAPVNLVVDFLFNEVLTAPTADFLKLQAQDNAMKRAGRRMSNAARRASTQATAAISSVVKQASNAIGQKTGRQNMRIATTRMIPGETMTAQSLAMASTASVVETFKQSRDSFKAHRDTLIGRNTVVANNNASIALALTAANDPNVSSIALFSEFEREVYAQREVLRMAERPAFDEQWGIGRNGCFADEVNKSLVPCLKHDTPKTILQNEIIHVQKEAMEKYQKLKIATDAQIGLELLHLFVLDLLGRESPAAKIFTAKSSNDFRHTMVVSNWAKRLGWTVVALMDMFFVYFAMLRGMQRGQAWQTGFATACVVQFVVEIFMFETTECIWMNYLIPDAASSEIQAIKFQLRRTVDSLCSASTMTHKYFLDAPEYFFISTVLAKRFPEKLESMIIASYHQHLPGGELAKKWKSGNSSKSRINRFWRNISIFAITNGIMKIIGTTPPTLQRVAVHSVQPLILASFAILILLLLENPIYASCFALPIIYQIFVYLYNYATTGVAFPKAEDENTEQYHGKKQSGMVHNTHHRSIFHGDVSPSLAQVPSIPTSTKPLTPPNSVMPQSLANALIENQVVSDTSLPVVPKAYVSSKKNGRNTVIKNVNQSTLSKEGSYTSIGLMVPSHNDGEVKPVLDIDIKAKQFKRMHGDNLKKIHNGEINKKADVRSAVSDGYSKPTIELALKPTAPRRTVIALQNSSSSNDSSNSSDSEPSFKRGDSKRWGDQKK